MKITDEILNKYIDGSLNKQGLEELSASLSVDPEMQKQLNELQKVHAALPKIEKLHAPGGFTENVMNRILNKSTLLVKDKKFFRFMCAIFAVLSASMIYWGLSSVGTDEKGSTFFGKTGEYLNRLIPDISFSVSAEYFILGSMFLVVVLLISVIYLWESHKNFNKQISKF